MRRANRPYRIANNKRLGCLDCRLHEQRREDVTWKILPNEVASGALSAKFGSKNER
jgi:hypothetical protein